MPKNSLGRQIPETFNGRRLTPYAGAHATRPDGMESARPLRRRDPERPKLLKGGLREAIEASGLRDGQTIATHHHLRNGDAVLVQVVREVDAMGMRDIRLFSSSIHPVHAELIPFIHKGVISAIHCGVNGPIGEQVSLGELECPITVRTHGGRARAMQTGDCPVDVAFIAAPTCDEEGNMNGSAGPSACGSLGYAHSDARWAHHVVAVTDNLVPYPATPVSIPQQLVDAVVQVPTLGDPKKIVSTTTRVAKDPVGLRIARFASQVIDASGLLVDGFSFQTGAGGTSLAVAERVRAMMRERQIKGSFGCGGITGYFVDMLEEGLFRALFDVQCFDLDAVRSIGKNPYHMEIGADTYANPFNAGAVVDRLDCVVLGATEVDVDFNVNVNTESNGYLLHNTGGHSDTAAGARLSIVVAPAIRGRLPIVKSAVTTVTTPGDTVDVIVTERGIAVNDRWAGLKDELLRRKLPVRDLADIQEETYALTGTPRPVEFTDDVIAVIEYRDGTIIDVVRRVKE